MAQKLLPPGRFEFEFKEELGRGGLGVVHRILVTASNASCIAVGSSWACKRLNWKWAQQPAMRERFEREIRAMRRMAHASIVSCEAENLPGGERFYVMRLFTGTLRRLIAGGARRGDWRYFAELGATLADAMQYAHDNGFIHRDLKPDNVLFDDDGTPAIADWGLGYFIHKESKVLQHLTNGGMGTEYYCPLEQWSSGKCDARGDIYALGMTLDECVTGKQRSILVGMGVNAPPVGEFSVAAIAFNALLRRMTEPFAIARPASMREVASELRRILAMK